MKTVLTTEKKVEIVANFLKQEGEVTKKDFALENGISTRSLSRYIDKHKEDAESVLAAKKREVAEKNKAPAKKAQNKSTRGYKGRNGRWGIIWEVIGEKGIDTKSKELLAEINRVSEERGLTQLSRASGYALLSIARKQLKD